MKTFKNNRIIKYSLLIFFSLLLFGDIYAQDTFADEYYNKNIAPASELPSQRTAAGLRSGWDEDDGPNGGGNGGNGGVVIDPIPIGDAGVAILASIGVYVFVVLRKKKANSVNI